MKRFDTQSLGYIGDLFNFLSLKQRLQMPKMIAYQKHTERRSNLLSKVLHISYVTIQQISAQARGPVGAMTHEAGCGPNYSHDWVCVCVSYNRVRNLPCLGGGSLDYKSSSPQSIRH
jgi:hypothetical protein